MYSLEVLTYGSDINACDFKNKHYLYTGTLVSEVDFSNKPGIN